MENNSENQFTNDLAPAPARPQFLKVLCILSFISCGLWILIYFLGSFAMALSLEKIATFWDKVLETQPHLENVDPVEFFHAIGKYCVMGLFANIASLVGVIMMWRLNKIGFFIYAVAEFVTYFFGMDLAAGGQEKSYGSTIFLIILDLAFIVMYAVNLKYMKKPAAAN
jgi:hypothetical protein